MIKLNLPPKPAELSQNEEALKEVFRNDTKSTPWKKSYIVIPLLEMTHDKCAYSEVKINEESKYMEIDHFKHKKKYPEYVVEWGNLLPSCKTCNTSKGAWDVVENPIINPLIDDPREHLSMSGFRLQAISPLGQNTLDAIDLNNTDQFVIPRCSDACNVASFLESEFNLLQNADTARKKHVHLNHLKSILDKCGPEHAFSASISNYIVYYWKPYPEIKKYLKENRFWDDEFAKITKLLESIALPPQNNK